MICVLGDEGAHQAVHHADQCTADDHDEELDEAHEEVHSLQISLADLSEAFHHVVQDLGTSGEMLIKFIF